MRSPVRVLIVDDSALMRRRLGTLIGSAPGFEVAGYASNGLECLSQIPALRPDVVTLDVEMPGLDGLGTLQRIMQEHPTPVLMVSSLTESGAQTSIDALSLGAVDCQAKPTVVPATPGSPFANEFLAKLSVVSRARLYRPARRPSAIPAATSTTGVQSAPVTAPVRRFPPAHPETWPAHQAAVPRTQVVAEAPPLGSPPALSHMPPASQSIVSPSTSAPSLSPRRMITASGRASVTMPLVVIGSSTGGPQALDVVFEQLVPVPSVAFLIVQHMPPIFTRSLAARLSKRSRLVVEEASEGDLVSDQRVLMAPGGQHMTVGSDGKAHLDQTPAIHGVRPALDRTLSSVADVWRGPVLAVVLTGMGVDGTDGVRLVYAKGAEVYAQDEATCVVYGMPRSIVDAGLASAVLPLDQIGPAVVQWAQSVARLSNLA